MVNESYDDQTLWKMYSPKPNPWFSSEIVYKGWGIATFEKPAGTIEGKTHDGIPVYNVSLPLLRRDHPEHPGFMLYEVPLKEAEMAAAGGDGRRTDYGRRATDR